MTTYETYTVTAAEISVPRMVWRRFKRPMPGMTERIFALNPGIAAMGPYLDMGTVVVIPIDSEEAKHKTARPVIQLWD